MAGVLGEDVDKCHICAAAAWGRGGGGDEGGAEDGQGRTEGLEKVHFLLLCVFACVCDRVDGIQLMVDFWLSVSKKG